MAASERASTVIQYPLQAGSWTTRVLETTGEGVPVVLLHGAGARADRWRSSLAVLAAHGHRALALDLPGHGLATKGAGPDFSVAGFATFVGDALDELGVDSAVLVGTSLGAHVMARLALDRRGLADRLVMVGPTGLVPLGPVMCETLAANLRERSFEGVRRKLMRVIADAARVDEDWVTEECRINNSPGAAESFELLARYFESRLDEDVLGPELAGRDFPLMTVWGEEDVVVPVPGEDEVRSLCGDVRVAYVPRAGHVPYAEQTDEFWKRVLPFVEE